MEHWSDIVRGVIRLDTGTFERFRDAPNVFQRGLLIFLSVMLIVGGIGFISHLGGNLLGKPQTPEQIISEMRSGFDQARQFMPTDPQVQAQMNFILENIEAGIELGYSIETLPPRLLPRTLSTVLEMWGRNIISHPLTRLGHFLAYAIWVMLFAKLLGGQGSLQQFLGTALLAGIPQIVGVLNWIPCLGFVLSVVGIVWSVVIYIKATEVAHRLDTARAAVAVLLPGVLYGLLISLGILTYIGFIISMIGRAGG
ncbi:MAG TPA: YIP1 family protein [Anaerolineae bacterium]|nr:YIP1 family protein [Anaerolineae bacterium]HIQ04780.1 YIP1 family protein [Anaerolineae bacterium]